MRPGGGVGKEQSFLLRDKFFADEKVNPWFVPCLEVSVRTYPLLAANHPAAIILLFPPLLITTPFILVSFRGIVVPRLLMAGRKVYRVPEDVDIADVAIHKTDHTFRVVYAGH